MKYTRKAKDLKPRKIFIFTEGSVTEQIYFKKFIDYFKSRRQVYKLSTGLPVNQAPRQYWITLLNLSSKENSWNPYCIKGMNTGW